MIKNFFNKLSIQISAIIIICGTLGVATFCLLYAGKESFFEFTQNLGVISENTEAYANNIENQIIDQNVSITDVDTLDKILGTSDIYSVNLIRLITLPLLVLLLPCLTILSSLQQYMILKQFITVTIIVQKLS